MGERRWARLLHRTADGIDARFGTPLRRRPLLARAWVGALDAIVAQQADRAYLRGAVLPAVAQAGFLRVLFVGVRGYTRRYGEAFQGTGTEYWTADIDPAAAPHGEPGRHVTGDVCTLDRLFPAAYFDLVLMNGVFGWGCDREDEMNRALAAIHAVLRPGGSLLVGWNTDRVGDPAALSAMAGRFVPARFAALPAVKAFPGGTHVYSWFRRR